MGYRCCELHDAADRTIDRFAELVRDKNITDAERRAWSNHLIRAVEASAFMVELPDGTIHTRKIG